MSLTASDAGCIMIYDVASGSVISTIDSRAVKESGAHEDPSMFSTCHFIQVEAILHRALHTGRSIYGTSHRRNVIKPSKITKMASGFPVQSGRNETRFGMRRQLLRNLLCYSNLTGIEYLSLSDLNSALILLCQNGFFANEHCLKSSSSTSESVGWVWTLNRMSWMV